MAENAPRSPPDRFARSLVLLIAFGTLVCAWSLHFTDWFPEIGGVLALGGALSWLAVVLKLLTEERTKELQEKFDALLRHRRTPSVLLGLIGLSLGLMTCSGSVELDARGEKADRLVRVGDTGGEGERLAAGATMRTLIWRWPGQSGDAVPIRVDGYPVNAFPVRRWHLETVRVPDAFLVGRRVVLLRPSAGAFNLMRNNPTALRVRRGANGKWITAIAAPDGHDEKGYQGEAVWIGCDASVAVPAEVLDAWREELQGALRLEGMAAWSHPRALSPEPWALEEGERIDVEIGFEGQPPMGRASFAVRRIDQMHRFPRIEIAEMPKPSP